MKKSHLFFVALVVVGIFFTSSNVLAYQLGHSDVQFETQRTVPPSLQSPPPTQFPIVNHTNPAQYIPTVEQLDEEYDGMLEAMRKASAADKKEIQRLAGINRNLAASLRKEKKSHEATKKLHGAEKRAHEETKSTLRSRTGERDVALGKLDTARGKIRDLNNELLVAKTALQEALDAVSAWKKEAEKFEQQAKDTWTRLLGAQQEFKDLDAKYTVLFWAFVLVIVAAVIILIFTIGKGLFSLGKPKAKKDGLDPETIEAGPAESEADRAAA